MVTPTINPVYLIVAREENDGYSLHPYGQNPSAAHGLTAAELVVRARHWEAREPRPRWVFVSVERDYPVLRDAGLRVRLCHDLALTEALLLAHDGNHDQSRWLAAAYARARGLEPPAEAAPAFEEEPAAQQALFDPRGSGLPDGVREAEAAEVVLAGQLRRIDAAPHPDRLRLLITAESASALAASEMSADGLPWHADRHDALLTELLGGRAPTGARPPALQELAVQVQEAFGGAGVPAVNPDAPGSVVRAFSRAGIQITAARAHVLREIDHPAVEPLLRYKELARLHSAHGWAWLSQWVRNGRFRPVYVVGGVVSGRWASRGGAALQIPRVLRSCVRAEEGWRLVVADAAQLEPRVLAALSGDRALAEVSASPDLYTNLATVLLGRAPSPPERARAKIAMLSAIYGGTAGEASSMLPLLRQRFPAAMSYVDAAANAGERGELVRSRLGRTSPWPSAAWRALTGGTGDEDRARRASRDWGRFTRNFVVQATAADWTAVLLALLRLRLPAPAHLVFFQHDEVLVYSPTDVAEHVVELLADAVGEATKLVFGPACPVHFPMPASIVETYADAK